MSSSQFDLKITVELRDQDDHKRELTDLTSLPEGSAAVADALANLLRLTPPTIVEEMLTQYLTAPGTATGRFDAVLKALATGIDHNPEDSEKALRGFLGRLSFSSLTEFLTPLGYLLFPAGAAPNAYCALALTYGRRIPPAHNTI
jgi:hypothetical protein